MTETAFRTLMGEVNDILCALNLMAWDARVTMPAGGVAGRGHQTATLTRLARDLATGDAMARAIDGARAETAHLPETDLRRRALDRAEAEIGVLARIPPRVIAEMAGLTSTANAAWVAARAANDFASFAPVLERMMALQREIAAAIGGAHPYDAMVGRFEPGMTHARLQDIYAPLKAALGPLIERARQAPPRMDFLERRYPVAAQKAFALKLARRMGYDLGRGRLDDTVHPFEISMTPGDVRITSRFRETWLPAGLFALWHEAGHGMYEQGLDPALARGVFATDLANLYAVGGASFGMHEAQSRLWENRVGRARDFWALHFGALRDTFPAELADVTDAEFWRAVNAVRPGPIRVEADELTYDLHIILRTEIEAGLVAGDLAVADLPAVWAERMRDLLGVEVPDDTTGVLQDVHWSHGYLGSFPTYTLGNIMGAQLFEAATAAPAVAGGLAAGDYAPLHGWLGDAVWRHGRSRTPEETLVAATGRGLDAGPYVAALTAKVEALTAGDTS